MREIVFDTETTGFGGGQIHRIVEIGAVEIVNLVPTGRSYQCYLNPDRPCDPEAFAVHGISDAFLAGQARFGECADALLDFLGDAPLVIHNASFDLGFLNQELRMIGRAEWPAGRAIDTLALAQRRFPGMRNSLDALCKRFDISLARREKHGALLDAELLAAVYLELKGGRQPDLHLAVAAERAVTLRAQVRAPRPHAASAEERAAHAAFLEGLTNPIWHRLSADAEVVAV